MHKDSLLEQIDVQGNMAAKLNTIDIVDLIIKEKVEGELCEAGVAYGGQIAIMAMALRDRGDCRPIHLYDSFNGHCKADPYDDEPNKERFGVQDTLDEVVIRSKRPAFSGIENVKNNMEKWQAKSSRLIYHEGYFQNILPKEAKEKSLPKKLSFLRSDCNLHASTHYVFKYLYPLVVKGGYICSDDWGNGGCQKATLDMLDEMGHPHPEVIPVVGLETTVWWKKEV